MGVGNQIWVKQLDRGPELLLTVEGELNRYPSWTPDGEAVTFHSNRGGGIDLWTRRADVNSPLRPGVDTVPVPLAATAFNEWSPTLSPDGQWMAYASDETGENEIWVVPFPDVSTKWVVSPQGGTEPVWSHSGEELFYRVGSGEPAKLIWVQSFFEELKERMRPN